MKYPHARYTFMLPSYFFLGPAVTPNFLNSRIATECPPTVATGPPSAKFCPPNQGRNERWQGERDSPGAESLRGRQIIAAGAEWLRGHRKAPTMSQVLSSIQYICARKTSVSNMGAPNLLLAPGAI